MEKIELENVDDAIKREKLFVRAAGRLLETLEFKGIEEGYSGELMRSQKEIDFCEKYQQKQADKMTRDHNERRLKKSSKEVELESEELDAEDFVGSMLTNKETEKKNKKKYKKGVTRSLRKRQVRSRQKRHRH